MRILLAPMEGVVDAEMRAVLTGLGGYDRCVTEFVRVTEQLLPNRVFYRFSPELKQGGMTPAGVPVYVQLLGGNAKYMALNAARLQKLQPPGIDLNFGCPSKTVNKHDGGSALLREPQRVGEIVAAVRDAVDPAIPVTAKIRLGFSDDSLLLDIAARVAEAGAAELCVHARTREDRYKPPAYWHLVRQVSAELSIPVIINGEIWDGDQAALACQQSGCRDVMIGRGALTRPDLAAAIKAQTLGTDYTAITWTQTIQLMTHYLRNTQNMHPKFVGNRAKQWLGFLQQTFPQANQLFHAIKRLKQSDEVLEIMQQHCELAPSQ